jgi:PAS domain-containing protein
MFARVVLEAMVAALERQAWDLIISDHSMPQFSSHAALALVRERGLDVPFICVSGTISEEQAVAAMRAGANDYLAKGQLGRLLPAIERELREARGRQARRASEASHATMVAHAPIGIYRAAPDGRFLSVNAAVVRLLGYDTADEVLHVDPYADPGEGQRLANPDVYTDREYREAEATWVRKDGRGRRSYRQAGSRRESIGLSPFRQRLQVQPGPKCATNHPCRRGRHRSASDEEQLWATRQTARSCSGVWRGCDDVDRDS